VALNNASDLLKNKVYKVNNLKAYTNDDVTCPNASANISITEFPFFKLQSFMFLKQRGFRILHGGCLRAFARGSKVRNSR